MDQLSLSDWMRRQRSLRDLTQEALAEEVGCAVQTIRAFENGWRRPSRHLAERLATILAILPTERAAFVQAARAPLAQRIAAPEPPQVAIDFGSYLTQLGATAHDHLYGPDQQLWLDRFDAEFETLQSALAWALDEQKPQLATRVTLALRTASTLERFWHGRGHQAEGQRWLEQGIDLVDRAGLHIAPDVLAAALNSAGWLAKIRADRTRAMALLQRGVALYRTIGDALGTSDALDTLGDLAIFEGDALAATWFHEEGLALRRRLGRPELVALSLHGLGHAEIVRGYYERAAERFLESLQILRDRTDPRSTALALHGLGLARLRQGSLADAAPHLSAALGMFQNLDNTLDVALCLELIGELLALRVLVGGANERLILEATRLWGASERLLESSGVNLSPPELARRDALITPARLRVGPERFQESWNDGRALLQSQAVIVGQAAARMNE
jgi:transcriptional regulator with XRE-family HTH domain